MQLHSQTDFTTIRTEGAILPPDLLTRVREGDSDLEGLRPEDYHLDAGEKLNERVSRSWNQLVGSWATFQTQAEKVKEDEPGTTVTRERWLLPLFEELGFVRLQISKAYELNGKSYPISHEWGCTPIHLVGLNVPLDRRTVGVAGAARTSPHSLVQEFLNRSDDHLWAFLSNGLQLRILRDNTSLTRQAYVEFDLESMMEGEVYADFALLWLFCHQSRVEGEKPEEFWLERWSQAAQEQGTRALDQLREGVEAAISILGAGYLAHPGNQVLKERLREGDLEPQEYYRQLLRMVYRLIFLFVAEDRDLLFDPEAEPETKARYREHYSTARLRRLAERRRGTRHPDLYRGLFVVMEKLGAEEGCSPLGLPGLGGFLWSEEAVSDLVECQLANRDLLEMVHSLAFTNEKRIRRAVDYKNLGPEELGSVYESLLELQPEMNVDAPTFELKVVGGSERKTTGSFYTPASLIQCLLDSALDPVVEEALKEEDPEQALLNLKICDPACGSGHFLVAAAHRVARRLASVRTGDEEPSPEAQRTALREVIGRCIYGVDINPMAVELCKVNLWLEAIHPGRPLTFLDDQILCGNSLLGTTPALMEKGIPDEAFKPIEGDDKKFATSLKKQNKRERPKDDLLKHGIESAQSSMFAEFAREERVNYALLQKEAIGIAETDDSSVKVVREKGEKYQALLESDAFRHSRLLANAWCAVFVWHKTPEAPEPITEASYRLLASKPDSISAATKKEIVRISGQYQFFHWHLAFPGVFWLPDGEDVPENEQTGWSGGFDVVLGNPPWEDIKFDSREFFSGNYPEIANARNTTERERLIQLLDEKTLILSRYRHENRHIRGFQRLIHESDLYPDSSFGRLNTAPIFTELVRKLISPIGRIGMIVPSGLATDSYRQHLFQDIVLSQQMESFYEFENEGFFGAGQGHMVRFALLTMTGKSQSVSSINFMFQGKELTELKQDDKVYRLTLDDLNLFNPNTKTSPIFRTVRDFAINRDIYLRVPILIKESNDSITNLWGIEAVLLFMSNSSSHLFSTREELENQGGVLFGSHFILGERRYLPYYEPKMIYQYDHRHGDFGLVSGGGRAHILPSPQEEDLKSPDHFILPFYWLNELDVINRLGGKWDRNWLIGWRNVTDARASARSVISSAIPLSASNEGFPILIFNKKRIDSSFLIIACFNSYVFDYVTRQKLGGLNLRYYIVKQLPIHGPEEFDQPSPWCNDISIRDWMFSRVLELVYTSWDMKSFADDFGYTGPPFRWSKNRRFMLRCELDAAFFHHYGIKRNDVEYIMDTFHIIKRRDEEEFGEYRTKGIIIEIYDEMQRAIKTGRPYHTRLDPPPADPRVAHPERE